MKNKSATTTVRLVKMLDMPVSAPACRLTAKRENKPETG